MTSGALNKFFGSRAHCTSFFGSRPSLRALHKFFGSRRLRASPQGYSPWTSVAHLPRASVPSASAALRQGPGPQAFAVRCGPRRPRARRPSAPALTVGRRVPVQVAQPRSRASSPGETPAGDDCQKTCARLSSWETRAGDDCQKTCSVHSSWFC
jgi:hypothetical protein